MTDVAISGKLAAAEAGCSSNGYPEIATAPSGLRNDRVGKCNAKLRLSEVCCPTSKECISVIGCFFVDTDGGGGLQ